MAFYIRNGSLDVDAMWKSQKRMEKGGQACNELGCCTDPACQKVWAFTAGGAIIGAIAGGSPTIGIGAAPGAVIGGIIGFGIGLWCVHSCKEESQARAARRA
jgi:hypothetical protein